MSHSTRAAYKAMYEPWSLTPAERAFTRGRIPTEYPDDSDWDSPGEPMDPESIPGHDYATDAENERHLDEVAPRVNPLAF